MKAGGPDRPAVLLLGNYRPALAISRALQPAGFHIIQGLEGDEGGCETSRHVAESWDHPQLAEGRSKFVGALDAYLRSRGDIGYVFPVSEEFVHALTRSNWSPPDGVKLIGPDSETVDLFSSKQRSLECARRCGVETLPFAIVSDFSAMLEKAAEIGFPVIIRPLGTTARLGHKKAVFAESPAQLQEAMPAWPAGHRELLLQRFATGSRHNVYFAARHGRLVASVESRILRTNHPDGTGLAVSGVTVAPTPVLTQATEALAMSANYTGIGLAQYMLDPATGRSCFIELNPRVSGSHAVPEDAGVPLSLLAIQLADAAREEPDFIAGKSGLRYVWFCGDVIGIKNAVKRGEIGLGRAIAAMALSIFDAFRADIHMVFRRDDPLPGIRALAFTVPKLPALAALLRQPALTTGKKHPG